MDGYCDICGEPRGSMIHEDNGSHGSHEFESEVSDPVERGRFYFDIMQGIRDNSRD